MARDIRGRSALLAWLDRLRTSWNSIFDDWATVGSGSGGCIRRDPAARGTQPRMPPAGVTSGIALKDLFETTLRLTSFLPQRHQMRNHVTHIRDTERH